MYDALSPKRTTLPRLEVVQAIARACLPDDEAAVTMWAGAWHSIALQEFTRANPRPARPEEDTRPPLRIVSNQ